MKVKADDNVTVIASYSYGDSNERLILEEAGVRTYHACDGSAEYVESGGSTTPQWSKTYIHLGARLLSTLTPNGSGGEFVQYHHPDRLGTRLVTNAQDTTSFEQVTLPFGTALNGESTGSTNPRFTSYDRSSTTGLDYALNRHYDPQQGRFTQVDPIEMDSVELDNPQTLNLYAYCANDPVNSVDPSGLGFFSFFKKVFKGIWKVLTSKWFVIAATVALTVITMGSSLGLWALTAANTSSVLGSSVTSALLFGTHTTALGWVAAVLSTALAIPGLGSLQTTLQRAASFGIGQAIGGLGQLASGIGRGIGAGGTPGWNPNAGTGVGGISSFTCDWGDCKGVVQRASDFGTGTADFVTFGLTKWYREWRGWSSDAEEERLANSGAYKGGQVFGLVADIATGAGAAKVGVRAAGYGVKLGVHNAHHTFGTLGKLSHLQMTVYRQGVKGSHRIKRLPLPFRRFPKKSRDIKL